MSAAWYLGLAAGINVVSILLAVVAIREQRRIAEQRRQLALDQQLARTRDYTGHVRLLTPRPFERSEP